mgnify:CR=1 FL=1
MMKTRVFIVRHTETIGNVEKRLTGRQDYEITERGQVLIQKLTKELKLDSFVIFTDKVDYSVVPAYFNTFDVVVSFSTTETQGLTIIEGLAASKPTICINDESFTAMIEPNYNGYLFKNNDEFKDYIFKLMNDDKLYKEMSINARNSIYKYSKEVFASDILKVYHKAIKGHNKTSED